MSPPSPDPCDAHTVGFYDSIDQLLDWSVRFCEDGGRAGQPVLVALPPHRAAMLHAALEDASHVRFVAHDQQFANPPGALQGLLDMARRHTDGDGDGPSPVRVLGEMPPTVGLGGDSWLRYEAATNQVLANYPLRRLCLYPTQGIPPALRTSLQRVHPMVVDVGGSLEGNPEYQDPATFFATKPVVRDPLEGQPPAIEVRDPSASDARQAVHALASDAGLAPSGVDAFVVAANEALTNATIHGRAPVTVRGWRASQRAVVAVNDTGHGPRDPLVGLRPAGTAGDGNGVGLWIAHQLCPETALSSSDDGFTVRLAAGNGDHANAGMGRPT